MRRKVTSAVVVFTVVSQAVARGMPPEDRAAAEPAMLDRAAQTLELEVRHELAREGGPSVDHEDAFRFLRSRDAFMRGVARDRRATAARDAFDAELARRSADAARGRLVTGNARLVEANRRLEEEIARERDRRGRAIFVAAFSFGLRIGLTALTGNPILAAAVSSGVGRLLNGGNLGDAVLAGMVDAGTAFGGQQLATVVAGADSAVAGRTHRAIGAGTVAGFTGGVRSAVHGGDPEDVLVAAGLNAGLAAATELVATEGTSEGGADRAGETSGGSGRSAGDAFLAELEIETTRGPMLAMGDGQPMAAGKIHKLSDAAVRLWKRCRKDKDCRDFGSRMGGDVVQDLMKRSIEHFTDGPPPAGSPGSPEEYGLPPGFPFRKPGIGELESQEW